jgi:hypothetical protein
MGKREKNELKWLTRSRNSTHIFKRLIILPVIRGGLTAVRVGVLAMLLMTRSRELANVFTQPLSPDLSSIPEFSRCRNSSSDSFTIAWAWEHEIC